MQQKKYIKDPVEIRNIKQIDGETIEDFIKQFKVETWRMKGAPECMRISGFMHGVNNPELTKCLNEHVPKTMKEMMIVTTAFIRGETATASKKKGHAPWKPQDQPKRHASERKSDFQGKLSHLIKEIKQGRELTKVGKKEASAKDKSLEIYMVQPWHRTTRQKVTQSFGHASEITFPPLTTSKGTKGPLVIEVELGGHMIHRMYVDGGSSTEVLYEHCFNWLRPEIKSQMVPTTTSLTGFSGEIIWPLGKLRLLVTIGDTDHATKASMNFMIVRSLSPYNSIIGRPGIREIQAVPSTTPECLSSRSTKEYEITFPPLTTSKGTEGPLVIEAEIGGHMIHRMYVDEGSSTEALGNNRRCRSCYKSMDEFHDCKVTITVQRYHWRLDKRNTGRGEIYKEVDVRHAILKSPYIRIPGSSRVAIDGRYPRKGRTKLLLTPKGKLRLFGMASRQNDRVTTISSGKSLISGRIFTCVDRNKGARHWNVPSHLSGRLEDVREFQDINKGLSRIVTFLKIDWKKSTGKSNLSAATPLSVS
ncbi:hypothetical protein Tco_0524563 [Tanacetum coccineum]